MNETFETCICGTKVPAGDTGLCVFCEEGLMEMPDLPVEREK